MIYTNMEDVFASSLMSAPVTSAQESDSVNDMAIKMQESDISSVVIMDDQNMSGIFTSKDLVDAINRSSDIREMRVVECMSEDPVTVSPKDKISLVESIMRRNNFDHLPVTTESGEVVGMISNSDVSDYLPRTI